jgi:redox-sensitive bicupin YhaK (pirin superfamily)
LGDGFQVRRALPSAKRRTVGPFVVFDQMGPAHFTAGTGLDVRPHPHIGLATVTYLFEGEIMHRDSLGNVQAIRPGEVNWMVAGSGIVHSERTSAEGRQLGNTLSGIQCWVALPKDKEEMEPGFDHYGAAELPYIEGDGVSLRLIAGTLNGEQSPVETASPMFYADVSFEEGARLGLTTEHEERAVYVTEGSVAVDGQRIEPGQLTVLRTRQAVTLTSNTEARVMLLGGAALDGPRHVWWNFVASSPERIEQAKSDWLHGRFGKVAGDPEFIPLPSDSPPPATPNYP